MEQIADNIKIKLNKGNVYLAFFENKKINKHSEKRIEAFYNEKILRKNFVSKTHSGSNSIVAFSKDFKVGVDSENKNRNISKSLEKKILAQNLDLNLRPIEIWVLMESTYKCINSKEHFTTYSFTKEKEWFVFNNNKKKIFSRLFPYKDDIISISLYKENFSIKDFDNRLALIY